MEDVCTLQETSYKGSSALLLSNSSIRVCIVPALGGKITSLQHVPSQREWLWSNPHLDARPVVYGESFIEHFDTGGVDECFPAVSGGEYPDAPWEGVIIPDHGELWCQPWQATVVESSAERIVLSMVCHGVRFPYRFERTLTLAAGRSSLLLDYAVTNLTSFDMPYTWCIHPILNIEEGMRLSLPDGVDTVRVYASTDSFMGASNTLQSWPLATTTEGKGFDLSQVPSRDLGHACKLFTLPLPANSTQATATIHDSKGEHSLGFRFRPSEISHVGLWLNYGGWSGSGSKPYFNLGLEPCIGGADSLPLSKQLGEYARLPAKQNQRWTLELLVD